MCFYVRVPIGSVSRLSSIMHYCVASCACMVQFEFALIDIKDINVCVIVLSL